MRIGRALSAILAPRYSWCMRCGTAWKFVEGRAVYYNKPSESTTDKPWGHFALCQECWDECDVEERVQHHMAAFNQYTDCWNDELEAAEILREVRATS